eukprot:SAG11_NODE_30264_length_302_cov_1.261084_1_plen_53_part_01
MSRWVVSYVLNLASTYCTSRYVIYIILYIDDVVYLIFWPATKVVLENVQSQLS